jgi:hypothetical protein
VNTFVRLLFVICICAITPAFAGGPAPTEPEQPASQSSAPAAPNAASQPATAQPSTTTNAASTTPATSEKTSTTQSPNAATASKVVLVDKTMTDAQVKQLLAKGYRPQARGGEVFYCRREAVLGSRFEQKICRSAEQLMRDEQDSKDMTERMQQSMGTPPGH